MDKETIIVRRREYQLMLTNFCLYFGTDVVNDKELLVRPI